MSIRTKRQARAARRAARQTTAESWKRCAEIPEIAKICRWVAMEEPLNAELQAYANSNPAKIRNGLAFLGIKFEVVQTETGVVFKKSKRAGGSRRNAVVRASEKLRPDNSPTGRNVKPTQASLAKRKVSYAWFYKSADWAKLRYQALLRSNGHCECCNSSKLDGAVLRVDHIKPIRTHPHLMKELSNLQVLCNRCNWGKGSWDETDWRYGDIYPIQSGTLERLSAEQVNALVKRSTGSK